MRHFNRIIALSSALWFGGCAVPNQQRELEYRLTQAEGRLADAQNATRDERARTAAFEQRMRAQKRTWETTKAENQALNERIKQLTDRQAKLVAAVEARAEKVPTRPRVPASPLLANVDRALAAFAEKYGGRVWYDRGQGAVSFANDRLFLAGSDAVRADAHAALGELASIPVLPEARGLELIIVGHTDDTAITNPETLARHATNWHLSVHRAIAVKNVLVAAGLPESRMGVMGFGSARPIGGDRARNRRVEIFLVRKGAVHSMSPVRASPSSRQRSPS